MTADDLRLLFDFHYWARTRLLRSLALLTDEAFIAPAPGSFASIRDTAVHIWNSERIWLDRWNAQESAPLPDIASAGALEQLWASTEREMHRFLTPLTDDDLQRPVTCALPDGSSRTWPIGVMAQHVVNHATYHRGQLTLLLRLAGHQVPQPMDYVVYFAKKMRAAAPAMLVGLLVLSLGKDHAMAQPRNVQPAPLRQATVVAIPGVVDAGTTWTTVWQGTDNADGLIADADGGLLFAQEQPSRVMRIGPDGRLSILATDTNGTGALGRDAQGRLIGVQRSCTDPGRAPEACTRPTVVAVLLPTPAVLADQADGQPFGRLNDLVVDQRGGVYVTVGVVHYVAADGRVSLVAGDVSSNGVALNPDETVLYITNGREILAFRRNSEGQTSDRRVFAQLTAGTGDGMAVDRVGRLYVTCQSGVEVFAANGDRLGLIPTPRNAISVAFAGPDRQDLFVVGSGALTPDGQEWQTPSGVRNNGKTIFRLRMRSQGLPTRAK